MKRYDAIIVGAGAGGGVAAGVLAGAGKRVLLLERGPDLGFGELGRDHLRNQRLSHYGHNAGPDVEGNPRILEDGRVVRPHEAGYQNNAAMVGSGTRVFGARAWRFMPQDFRMASIYGVPPGSSLADWPIGYEDLEPWYEKVEWEIGVSGDHRAMTHLPPYRRPYPMPPLPPNAQVRAGQAALQALGWNALPIPQFINSVPYKGRPACIRCQHCVGFACPVDAKNGTRNTTIEAALRSGNCELRPGVMVERVDCDDGGRVRGVNWFKADGRPDSAEAEVVIVSAGATESARLLLNSATRREPRGLGNQSDQVGRHLQGHFNATIRGIFPQPVMDNLGPGGGIGTCDFNHGNADVIGGGILIDNLIVLPVIFWKRFTPPDLPRWGLAAKRFMRDSYRFVGEAKGTIQEIPNPDARVTLDPVVRDKFGIPVLRLSGTTHPETLRTVDFMYERAREWWRAAGVQRLWGTGGTLRLGGGQHQAGTCRMGDDPAQSVVDRWQRVHGHDNLFVLDGSVHVTNGGFNPVLTIMALAWRAADRILAQW